MITVWQINIGDTEKSEKNGLITYIYKCIELAHVLKLFFYRKMALFLNFEQKWVSMFLWKKYSKILN